MNFGLAAATLLAYLAPYVDPLDFWPLIFFGLAYPGFLLGNLIFIVFWFFVKKRMIWISFLVVLLGIQHVPKTIGFNLSVPKNHEATKILSFNTGGFYQFRKHGNFEKEDIKPFSAFLKKWSFDVACFQEFLDYYKRTSKVEIDHFFSNIENTNPRVLIGSKTKIKAKGKLEFDFKTNGISWADIVLEEKTVRVYNLHLKSNGVSTLTNTFSFRSDFFSKKGLEYLTNVLPRYKEAAISRVKMVEKLKSHIETCPYPIIICGDLNDPPLSYSYQQISEGMKDAFVEKGFGWGKTYNGKIPGLRIDYIFVSPEIEVVDFKIVKNDFSDHFPVICSLKLNEG